MYGTWSLMKYYTMMHKKYFKYNIFYINIHTRFAWGWELVGYFNTLIVYLMKRQKSVNVNSITM